MRQGNWDGRDSTGTTPIQTYLSCLLLFSVLSFSYPHRVAIFPLYLCCPLRTGLIQALQQVVGVAAIYSHFLAKHGGVGTRRKRDISDKSPDGDAAAAASKKNNASCVCGGTTGSCKVRREASDMSSRRRLPFFFVLHFLSVLFAVGWLELPYIVFIAQKRKRPCASAGQFVVTLRVMGVGEYRGAPDLNEVKDTVARMQQPVIPRLFSLLWVAMSWQRPT